MIPSFEGGGVEGNYCGISASSNILMGGEGNYCGISASSNDILMGGGG